VAGGWLYALAVSGVDRNEPAVHEPGSIWGRRNKSGNYAIPPYVLGGEPISHIVLDHG